MLTMLWLCLSSGSGQLSVGELTTLMVVYGLIVCMGITILQYITDKIRGKHK